MLSSKGLKIAIIAFLEKKKENEQVNQQSDCLKFKTFKEAVGFKTVHFVTEFSCLILQEYKS